MMDGRELSIRQSYPQKKELEFASRQLPSIEINRTETLNFWAHRIKAWCKGKQPGDKLTLMLQKIIGTKVAH